MRTAVLRINVDPEDVLSGQQLSAGTAQLRCGAVDLGAELIDVDLALAPSGRREVELLMPGDDPAELHRAGSHCARQFSGCFPVPVWSPSSAVEQTRTRMAFWPGSG